MCIVIPLHYRPVLLYYYHIFFSEIYTYMLIHPFSNRFTIFICIIPLYIPNMSLYGCYFHGKIAKNHLCFLFGFIFTQEPTRVCFYLAFRFNFFFFFVLPLFLFLISQYNRVRERTTNLCMITYASKCFPQMWVFIVCIENPIFWLLSLLVLSFCFWLCFSSLNVFRCEFWFILLEFIYIWTRNSTPSHRITVMFFCLSVSFPVSRCM